MRWENDGQNEKKNAFGSLYTAYTAVRRNCRCMLHLLWTCEDTRSFIDVHGDVCVYSSSKGRTGFILFYFTTDLYARPAGGHLQSGVCVSSEDVLASAYKDNHARWLAHLIIIIISRDRLYSPPHPRPSLSLSPRSGPGRPAGMDAHSGTFQISFSQGARKAIIRTAVSGSTGSPPSKKSNQISLPTRNWELNLKTKIIGVITIPCLLSVCALMIFAWFLMVTFF